MPLLDNLKPVTDSLSADDRETLEIALALARATRQRRLDISDLARLCITLAYKLNASEAALQAERREVDRLGALLETYRRALIMSGIAEETIDAPPPQE